MRKRIISMLFVLSAFIVPASVQAQWVVSDPGNLVQGNLEDIRTGTGVLREAAQGERPDQRQRESQGVRPDAR